METIQSNQSKTLADVKSGNDKLSEQVQDLASKIDNSTTEKNIAALASGLKSLTDTVSTLVESQKQAQSQKDEVAKATALQVAQMGINEDERPSTVSNNSQSIREQFLAMAPGKAKSEFFNRNIGDLSKRPTRISSLRSKEIEYG